MRFSRWFGLLIVLVLLSGLPANARPRGHSGMALQVRFGGFFPDGGGDFWKETAETFSLDTSDFNDFVLGVSVVTPVTNSLEVGFNVDFYEQTVTSAYNDFVDEFGFPIFHDSTLEVIPVVVDFRVIPGGRLGVRGSRGQYRVQKPAFYVGGGIGATYWEYEEIGDFLDFGFDPPEIFFDRFKETGVAFAVHAVAGVELPVGDNWGFLIEGRYLWADDQLGGDFAGLGTLQLDGASIYGGFSIHY